MPDKKDKTEFVEWKEWHDDVKRRLKNLLSNKGKVEIETTFHIGEEKYWGHLDSYKPDVILRENEYLSIFEIETYYEQEKIIRDIVYATLLGAKQLVLIFSDKKTDWGDGKKRAQATEYLGEIIHTKMPESPIVKALYLRTTEELEEKLKKGKIL